MAAQWRKTISSNGLIRTCACGGSHQPDSTHAVGLFVVEEACQASSGGRKLKSSAHSQTRARVFFQD